MQGTIYADQLSAESDRRRGLNILSNSDVTEPALRAGSTLARVRRYLHWRELAWVWRSDRLREPPPLGWDLPRILFASFWGQFGWMSLPLVGGTPWESALALICLGGLLGTVGWLISARAAAWQRRAVRAAAADHRGRNAVSIAVRLHPAAQPGDSAGALLLSGAGADRAAAGAGLARAAAGALAHGRANLRWRMERAVCAGRASADCWFYRI